MFWFKKPKKLNETTRLYALYGESANLSFLDSAIKDNNSKIDTNTNNIETNRNNIETNRNNITTNANRIEEVKNRLDNLPPVDLSNVGKLNGNNTWTGTNVFRRELKMLDKLNMSGFKLYNLPTPTDNWDAATKQYVDTQDRALSHRIDNIQISGSSSGVKVSEIELVLRGSGWWISGESFGAGQTEVFMGAILPNPFLSKYDFEIINLTPNKEYQILMILDRIFVPSNNNWGIKQNMFLHTFNDTANSSGKIVRKNHYIYWGRPIVYADINNGFDPDQMRTKILIIALPKD